VTLIRRGGRPRTLAEFEIGQGDGVPGPARRRILDPGKTDVEVAAFDRLVDTGPLKPGRSGPSGRPSPRAIPFRRPSTSEKKPPGTRAGLGWIGLYERSSTLGVAAPKPETESALRALGEAE